MSVSEEMGMVSVCFTVERPPIECPVDFSFNIAFSTMDDEAGIGLCCFISCFRILHAFCLYFETSVSSEDFTAFKATRKFPVCTTSLCVNIFINDDTILEKNEFFKVFVMVENQENITLHQSDVFVLVMDNEKGMNWLSNEIPIV